MKGSIIEKTLSANDTGETGGHQAGMLIPKRKEILSFFPSLTSTKLKNPRRELLFTDSSGEQWPFSFIYYNNRYFGGTRNEYRLTGMTKFIRKHNLKYGDQILLERHEGNKFLIKHKRQNEPKFSAEGVLTVKLSWKVVNA